MFASSVSRCSIYLLVSALSERRRWLTLGFILIERWRSVDFAGWGGEEGLLLKSLSEALESGRKVLFDGRRCLTLLGLCEIVELPMSCRTPLDCLVRIAGEPTLVPAGDTFSTSEDPRIVLRDDQLLDDIDFGVASRVGRAAPLNPALRSCSFFAWRELFEPGDGLGELSTLSLLLALRSAGELRFASALIMLGRPRRVGGLSGPGQPCTVQTYGLAAMHRGSLTDRRGPIAGV